MLGVTGRSPRFQPNPPHPTPQLNNLGIGFPLALQWIPLNIHIPMLILILHHLPIHSIPVGRLLQQGICQLLSPPTHRPIRHLDILPCVFHPLGCNGEIFLPRTEFFTGAELGLEEGVHLASGFGDVVLVIGEEGVYVVRGCVGGLRVGNVVLLHLLFLY